MRLDLDRKSTRLNSSHTEIYTLSLHDALPISFLSDIFAGRVGQMLSNQIYPMKFFGEKNEVNAAGFRSEEHTSELQSHRDLHSFPTRRSSDLFLKRHFRRQGWTNAVQPNLSNEILRRKKRG